MRILLATGNRHKVREIGEILDEFRDNFVSLDDFEKLPEPVEDGRTYRENAIKKALHYYRLTGIPSLADDSGLEIDAFDGEPGIRSARFIEPEMSFADRSRIILERMKDLPSEKRGARFVCCTALILSEDDIRIETGKLEGEIGSEIKGSHGFGYDPIFLLPGRGIHLAEMPEDEKNKISHRALALKEMEKHLHGLIGEKS